MYLSFELFRTISVLSYTDTTLSISRDCLDVRQAEFCSVGIGFKHRSCNWKSKSYICMYSSILNVPTCGFEGPNMSCSLGAQMCMSVPCLWMGDCVPFPLHPTLVPLHNALLPGILFRGADFLLRALFRYILLRY